MSIHALRVHESMYSKVYTLAMKQSLYRYFRAKVYAIWVHEPLGHAYTSLYL